MYLHIGAHRTATTSIQEFLAANRQNLQKNGYLVPFGTARHMVQANHLFSGKITPRELANRIEKQCDESEYPIDKIILSDEDICKRTNLECFAKLSKFFDLKVIYAMRRQDLWLESWWSQNVKGQWDKALANKSLPDFILDRRMFHWIDYDAFIRGLSARFGDDALILFPFEKGAMPQGVVAKFCEVIGLNDISGFKPPGRTNGSFTPSVSEIARQLPFQTAPRHQRRELIRCLSYADRHFKALNLPKLILPYEERAALMQEYAPGNAAVARRYFGREELFLEPLPSPDQPVADLSLNPAGEEMIRLVLRPFIEGLIEIEAKKPQAAKRPAMLRPARSQA